MITLPPDVAEFLKVWVAVNAAAFVVCAVLAYLGGRWAPEIWVYIDKRISRSHLPSSASAADPSFTRAGEPAE